jgi:hypothetical protein
LSRSNNALRGRQNKNAGDVYEALISSALYRIGFERIEKITNTWRPVRIDRRDGGAIIGKFVPARVSGDFSAIDPQDGRSVLVEVKGRAGSLSWGELKDHQKDALSETASLNGIALVAWVDTGSPNSDLYIMRWPIDGFGKGNPIKPEQAAGLCIIPR